jgi:hypothetical protein
MHSPKEAENELFSSTIDGDENVLIGERRSFLLNSPV